MQIAPSPLAPQSIGPAPAPVEPKVAKPGSDFEKPQQRGFDATMQHNHRPQIADNSEQASVHAVAEDPAPPAPAGARGRRVNLSV